MSTSIDPYSAYTTREVDPSVFTPDSTFTPSGTATITLNNGSTVAMTQNLYLDSSTYVAPTTAGHSVYVYRPVDPGALQSFINQYSSSASSADVTSTTRFTDISGGTVDFTVVDFKGSYDANGPRYIGSTGVTPPTRSGDCPPRCPM